MPNPNTQPLAVGLIKNGQAIGTTLNTGRDSSGTVGTNLFLLYTAGLSGAIIPRIRAVHMGPTGTLSTAMSLRLFKWSSGGGVKTLIDEALLPAATPTVGTVLGAAVTFPKGNYFLAPGEALYVAQTASENVGYEADQGGDT